MKLLANLSIRIKIAGTILVAILVSLGAGFTLVILANLRQFENDLLKTTELITRATGDYNAVYVQFEERGAAEEALGQLKFFDYITEAHIYDNDGRLFVSYPRDAAKTACRRSATASCSTPRRSLSRTSATARSSSAAPPTS